MPVVSTLTVDLVARTASFEGPLGKAAETGKRSAKDIQDSFNKMDMGEARGGIMVLDELIGVHLSRHVQSFVAMLPGVGIALSAAFPVLAIIAIGDAIYKATEAAKKNREEMEKNRQAALDSADAMAKHTESMQLNNLKMTDQIALLEGRPAKNKLQEALLEAKIAAGDLLVQLDKDNKEAISLLEKMSVGSWGSALTGAPDTSKQTEDAKNKLNDLTRAQKAYLQAVQQGVNDPDRLQPLISNVRTAAGEVEKLAKAWKDKTDAEVLDNSRTYQQKIHNEAPDPVFKKAEEGKHTSERASQQQLFAIAQQSQMQITAMEAEQQDIRKKGKLDQMAADIQNLDKVYAAAKQVTAAQTKEALAAYQVEFDQGKITAVQLADLKQQALDKEYQAELAHLEKVKALEAGEPALVQQTNQEIAALKATHNAQILGDYAATLNKQKELEKEFTRLLAEESHVRSADVDKETSAKTTALMDYLARYQSSADKISQLQRGINDQDAIQVQRMAVATGQLTEQKATQQALKTLDQNKKDALADINHELDVQLSRVNALAAAGGGTSTPEYAKAVLAYQAMETRKLEITKQFNAQIDAERLKAANNEQSQWRKMALEFGQIQQHMSQLARQTIGQMNSSIAAFVVTGTGNFRQLAVSAAESFITMGLEYVESKTIMLAIDAIFGSNRDKDKEKAIASNVMLATSAAALAASQTLALTSAVFLPPIPESLAAMAFGVGMGFAGFAAAERGAVLPNRDMMVHTHPQEMILPQHISNFVVNAASMASGRTGGGHTIYVNPVFAPTIQAINSTGVKEMLKTHHTEFHDHLMNSLRSLNY